ncbi:MAG: hypothetical protein Pars2KO_00720 [Parasphingorhabdus sp.]
MDNVESKQIVKYSPVNPSVIFHRMRTGMSGKWDQNNLVQSIRKWLRPPKQHSSTKAQNMPLKKPTSLIIPDANDPFMLMAKSDPMSSLLAENQRLKNLINDLVREDRRSSSFKLPY